MNHLAIILTHDQLREIIANEVTRILPKFVPDANRPLQMSCKQAMYNFEQAKMF